MNLLKIKKEIIKNIKLKVLIKIKSTIMENFYINFVFLIKISSLLKLADRIRSKYILR
jgi:hypothetical protein